MGSRRRNVEMGFTRRTFPEGTHMCLIFSDESERRRLMHAFLRAGIAARERVAYFTDTAPPQRVRDWLKTSASPFSEDDSPDQMVVSVAEETYCPRGRFDPADMLAKLRGFHEGALQAGFPGSRASGEMTWAARGLPGSDRLMEYESLVNDVLLTHPITAICQYDANRFDGDTLLDVLKVHPMMVVHGQVVRNPFYIKPDEFLADLARRDKPCRPRSR